MDKEAALRLGELAEAKFNESNLKAAIKYAKRACRLCPKTDSFSTMLTSFKILRAASESRAAPEWYSILQVEPFCQLSTIKKQYKKLALILHPDKNPHAGSEEAFKLINEGFRFLSDKIRRKEYDMKLRIQLQDEKMKETEESIWGDMFWTACSSCRVLHQFDRKYLRHVLACPSCKTSFEAVEIGDEDVGGEDRDDDNSVKSDDETMTLAEFQAQVKRKARKEKTSVTLKEKEKKGRGSSLVKKKGSRDGDLDSMAVKDSDFHDFDRDRVEKSFKKRQIWAVYDDDNGMPRHYVLIDEVVSVNPFEVKISWLDLQRENGNYGKESRLSCGRFTVSKKTPVSSVNVFSHEVDCERAAKEAYRIFPKKGSVWAIYKKSTRSNEEDKRCYDIVVSLTSYSDVYGVSMAYLEKVDGFKTIFKRREIGSHAILWVEKDGVEIFSHQIPGKKLSGDEAPHLPRDCWELDPASLPADLLTLGSESGHLEIS